MSCWVVPAVAAEYWGVSLTTVWDRICTDQVPHKAEGGFLFVDVDPWGTDCADAPGREPPPTYIAADEAIEASGTYNELEPVAATDTFEPQPLTDLWDQGDEREDVLAGDEEDLPVLDEEESATFGRLNWAEVRGRVSRTRRPPPSSAAA